MSLVAVREDFPTHKELIDNLRPYLIFSKGFNHALSEYMTFYEELQSINKQDQIFMFLENPEATRVILGHLNNLKNKA